LNMQYADKKGLKEEDAPEMKEQDITRTLTSILSRCERITCAKNKRKTRE